MLYLVGNNGEIKDFITYKYWLNTPALAVLYTYYKF